MTDRAPAPAKKPTRSAKTRETSRQTDTAERGAGSRSGMVIGLQQRAGNRAVGRMLGGGSIGGVHLGPADDRFEHEADRVARIVTQRLQSGGRSSGKVPLGGPPPAIGAVQRAPVPGATKGGGGAQIGEALGRARGRGRAMSAPVRSAMEGAFGHSFDGVRLHTDSAADRLTRSVGARAMTTGKDVFFRLGEYRPKTRGGRMLLAHELTHVLQQRGNPSGYVQRKIGFEFQSVGATHNVKVSQVTPVDHESAREATKFKYTGRSSEETLVGSWSDDRARWVSDSGDLELVTRAVDESDDGKRMMMAQARHARQSLAGLAKAARKIDLVGAPLKGASPKKARRRLKRSGLAESMKKLEGLFGAPPERTKVSKEWATILPPRSGKKKAIAVRWMNHRNSTDQINFTPQMTIGLTMENMGRFISMQLDTDRESSNPLRGLVGYGKGAHRMSTQLAAIDAWLESASKRLTADLSGLAGMLKVIGAIIVNARLRIDAGKGADYLKDLAPWMHRTSLGDAFQLLSDVEKAAFADFRRDKVLEDVGTWEGGHGAWAFPHLGKEQSRDRSAGKGTDKILAEIMAGVDPFNRIEDIGIGEIVDSHEAVLDKYHVDRSTDIDSGPEGRDRKGMIVEVRRLASGGVTAAGMEKYVDKVMSAVLSDGWRSDYVERERPERKKKKAPVMKPPPLPGISGISGVAPMAPAPMAPMAPMAPAPMAPTPEEVKKLVGVPVPIALSMGGTSSEENYTKKLHELRLRMGPKKPMKMHTDQLVITGRPRWFVGIPDPIKARPLGGLTSARTTTTDEVHPRSKGPTPDDGTTDTVTSSAPKRERRSKGKAPTTTESRADRAVREMRELLAGHEATLFTAPATFEPTYAEWMANFEGLVDASVRRVWRSAGYAGQGAIRRAWSRGELGQCRLDRILGWY